MSVFSIRLFQPSTKIGDNEIFRDLQKLEELLAFQPTDYNGIIVMARAIVDAAGVRKTSYSMRNSISYCSNARNRAR